MELNVVLNLVANALEVDENLITGNSSSETIEQWDSLGQISILAQLDDTYPNVTERIPQLATATSVSEILRLLTESGL
jgi:hypothetical protein